ncbi:MAG: hypothetical protein [Inoviridae sp.]|nr:MAG: hypothetical protein [Inoviridae sp.]
MFTNFGGRSTNGNSGIKHFTASGFSSINRIGSTSRDGIKSCPTTCRSSSVRINRKKDKEGRDNKSKESSHVHNKILCYLIRIQEAIRIAKIGSQLSKLASSIINRL